MDHLPYPKDPTNPPLDVPYICEDVFSSHELCKDESGRLKIPNFSEFLKWNYEKSQAVDFPGPIDDTDPQIPALIQAFAFFGLLKDCIEGFQLDDFLTEPSGESQKRLVTLKCLPQRLVTTCERNTKLLSQIQQLETPADLKIYDEVRHVHLKRRRLLVDALTLVSYHASTTSHGEIIQVIQLSIEVLAWSLLDSLPISEKLRHAFEGLKYNGHIFSPNAILNKRFASSRWCPYWVSIYNKTYSAPLLYYMSGLCQNGHTSCSEKGCISYDVGPSYTPQHVVSSCGCALYAPDVERIKKIIISGGIPVLRLMKNSGSSSEVNVEVIEANRETSFVALSHVWSQGLGNPYDNSIHMCQLHDLFDALSVEPFEDAIISAMRGVRFWNMRPLQKYGTQFAQLIWKRLSKKLPLWQPAAINVWMDTLCIPCKEEDSALRDLSINKMAMVYASAARVLVVDRELSGISEHTSPKLVTAIRLATCAWMTRKWTFQEACLAKYFSFAFRDGPLSPSTWGKITDRHLHGSAQGTTQEEKRLQYEVMRNISSIPSITNSASNMVKYDDVVELLVSVAAAEGFKLPLAYWYSVVQPTEDHGSGDGMVKSGNLKTMVQDAQLQLQEFVDMTTKRHTLSMDQLSIIWNQVATRSTSKNEDIHVILAALLGLSVREILSLPLYDRTKAVLKTLEYLPLAMFYGVFDDNTEMVPGYDWIPMYPAGNLVWEETATKKGRHTTEEYMRWTEKGHLLVNFNPPIVHSSIHAMFSSQVLPREFYVGHDKNGKARKYLKYFLPNNPSRRKKIALQLKEEHLSWDGHTPHGFLLTMKWDDTRGAGACFVLKKPWKSLQDQPKVHFLCPIRFLEGQSQIYDDSGKAIPVLKVDTCLSHGSSFVIKTDSKHWPSLNYRRSSGYVHVTGSIGGWFDIIVGGMVWDFSIIFYLILELCKMFPVFQVWNLYPLAKIKLVHMVAMIGEDRLGIVPGRVHKERVYAVAKSFDVENTEAETGNGPLGTTLYQTPVLYARGLLGILCLGFSYQNSNGPRKWIWRTGSIFVLECITRAAAEIVWHKWKLNRLSTWQGIVEGLLRSRLVEAYGFEEQDKEIKDRVRRWRSMLIKRFRKS